MGTYRTEGDRRTKYETNGEERRKVYDYPGVMFPDGRWKVSIKGVDVMEFRGEDIRGTEFGVFFVHRASGAGMHDRVSFFPWHKVDRMFTTGG